MYVNLAMFKNLKYSEIEKNMNFKNVQKYNYFAKYVNIQEFQKIIANLENSSKFKMLTNLNFYGN